mgnify:CR=1 FL=1
MDAGRGHGGGDDPRLLRAGGHHLVHVREDAFLDALQAAALLLDAGVPLQLEPAAFAQVVQIVGVIQDGGAGVAADQVQHRAGHVRAGGPDTVQEASVGGQPALQRLRRVQHLDAVLLQDGGIGLQGRRVSGWQEGDAPAERAQQPQVLADGQAAGVAVGTRSSMTRMVPDRGGRSRCWNGAAPGAGWPGSSRAHLAQNRAWFSRLWRFRASAP